MKKQQDAKIIINKTDVTQNAHSIVFRGHFAAFCGKVPSKNALFGTFDSEQVIFTKGFAFQCVRYAKLQHSGNTILHSVKFSLG